MLNRYTPIFTDLESYLPFVLLFGKYNLKISVSKLDIFS